MAEKRARRPKGTGGIRNRGTARNPRWFGFHYVYFEGRRRQVTQGPFRTKAEAEDWVQSEVRRTQEGRPTLPSHITVAELLDEWLAVRRAGLEPSTYNEYERIARHRITPHLGHRKVKELRPLHVAQMFAALREPGANRRGKARRGLSETSLQHTHAALRSALDYAIRQSIVAHNVMVDVDRPRRETTRIAFWTAEDLATFLRRVEGDRLAPLLRLASHTGARRSELLGLHWMHLDLDAATMSVAGRRTRVGYEMVDRAGAKTAAGARVVDLDPTTVAVMARWRDDQAADREAWGEAYVEAGYVFTAENGEPTHADYVAQRFARLVATAGVPSIRFHDLRHTHATCCSRRACPSTSSRSAWGTPRPQSRCRSTATCCLASSPRPRPRSLALLMRPAGKDCGDDATGPPR